MTFSTLRPRALVVAVATAGALMATEVKPLAAQSSMPQKPFAFTDVDARLHEQVELLDAKLERDGLVVSDAPLNEFVTRIGHSVVGDTIAPERVQFRFRVVRDPSANAFALPNGSIYVHTGLLALLDNEQQLASVLAHEVAHVVNRHSYLAFRSYRKKALAATLVGFAGGMVPGGSTWGQAIQVVASTVPVILSATIDGYARELERDADRSGVQRLLAAEYDATEMARSFELLRASSDLEAEPLFYTDHPKLELRINDVTAMLSGQPLQRPTPEAAEQARVRYVRVTRPALSENVGLAIAARRFRTAVATARRLEEWDSRDSAQGVYWLGESLRALGPRTPEPAPAELTEKARKDARKHRSRVTAAEAERALLKTASGRAAWEQNARDAEAAYKQALERDPAMCEALRGLGLLLEAARPLDAIDAFIRYEACDPHARDALQIRRRADSLRSKSSDSPTALRR